MNVLIISFSSRAGGNCDKISEKIAELYSKSTFFRFSDQQIHPCGGCQYECFGTEKQCPYLADPEYSLLDFICRSDLVYFVIPNYCDYPCANYFIFNERSQCYFQGKPERLDVYLNVAKKFIVVSNTNQANFEEILAQQTSNSPDILFLSAKKFGKRSIFGDLTDSGDVLHEIRKFTDK